MALVMGMTFIVVSGCTRTLPLSRAPGAVPAHGGRLAGVAVRIEEVRDETGSPQVGRHRDGLLRVPRFSYRTEPSVAKALGQMVRAALVESGARVSTGSDPALCLRIHLMRVDLTTDGVLAGEETFGAIAVRVVVTDAVGRVVSDTPHTTTFAHPDLADADLLRRSLSNLADAIAAGVRGSAPETPSSAPASG